jgi:single-stranded-DNA-specific exonuclease
MLQVIENKAYSGHSLTQRSWIVREGADGLVAALSQRYGLPDILARVLAARGVGLEEAEVFLSPSLKALMPDPSHLLDMDAAAQRVASAIAGGETIAVFGDYDVDGATSSALLLRYFQALGCKSLVHIPDRITEGYGPSPAAFRRLKELRNPVGGVQGRTSSTGPQGSEPLHGTFAGPYSAEAQAGWGSAA